MKILTADIIFTVKNNPILNGYIVLDDENKITNVFKSLPEKFKNFDIIKYKGAITPGFFNSHCHLELSQLINRIDKKLGLQNFIAEIGKIRDTSEKKILLEIEKQDKKMFSNGIVFVGDISNNTITKNTKLKSKISYHTFIEIFGLAINSSNEKISSAKKMALSFKNNVSITPHSPYSVSDNLFKEIKELYRNNPHLISIHNQECEAENELFKTKSGKLYESIKRFAPDIDAIKTTGESSIVSYLSKLPLNCKTLFVHNTHTSSEDIDFVNKYHNNSFWCLCPNSNLYIEEKLPNVDLFIEKKSKLLLGTDSLASNTKLSILSEIITVITNFENVKFSEVLKWATINAAEYFNIDNKFGSIETDKQPGLNLITNFDIKNLKPTTKSKVINILE